MKLKIKITGLFLICLLSNFNSTAQEGYIGEVRIFAGNFAPRGWALCQGQLLAISQNTALFSIVGTIYGGDGRTSFGLPDLRGRAAIGSGNGPGLSTYREGSQGGRENITLTVSGESNGFWGGTNGSGITEFVERFSVPGDETLDGISFGVGKLVLKSGAESEITVKVYNGNRDLVGQIF